MNDMRKLMEAVRGFSDIEVDTMRDDFYIGDLEGTGTVITVIDRSKFTDRARQGDFADLEPSPEDLKALVQDIAGEIDRWSYDTAGEYIGLYVDVGTPEYDKKLRAGVVSNTMFAHLSPIGEDRDDTLWFKNQ